MTQREKLIELFEQWKDENHCNTCCDIDCESCYEDSCDGLFKFFVDNGVIVKTSNS